MKCVDGTLPILEGTITSEIICITLLCQKIEFVQISTSSVWKNADRSWFHYIIIPSIKIEYHIQFVLTQTFDHHTKNF